MPPPSKSKGYESTASESSTARTGIDLFQMPASSSSSGNTTSKRSASVERSPFFRPSDPRQLVPQQIRTPGGTTKVRLQKKRVEEEHKSGILGTSANLVVSIVGAGIVGLPYAMKQAGLLAGLLMTLLSAAACDKSLRLLIETAKHVDVPSYETLFEASFGPRGFQSMCSIMFVMSYGAMISYLMIMKDMLAGLFGIGADDEPMRRTVLVIATLLVALPLSSQRDMADLAKTSRFSVFFYLCIVSFVMICSPVESSVRANGGWKRTITETMIRPNTFFVGFGVLTFAFVCQHSAFILAGSLDRPTRSRWAQVTALSLVVSGILAVLCGVIGYLGFLDQTDGNILANFESIEHPLVRQANQVARAMLLACMFFVYPMDAFVLRHVSMVLVFKGRAAHEGIDHLVLARTDRRVLLTLALYLLTLLPALFLTDVGSVLAVTGAVAASALSYICPGASYLAVHGGEFKKLVNKKWCWGHPDRKAGIIRELESGEMNATVDSITAGLCATVARTIRNGLGRGAWYIFLMPLWMSIAEYGQKNLLEHAEKEALKSPAPVKRLGKITHKRGLSDRAMGLHTPDFSDMVGKAATATEKSPLLLDLDARQLIPPRRTYSIPDNLEEVGIDKSTAGIIISSQSAVGAVGGKRQQNNMAVALASGGGNRAIGAAIASANAASAAACAPSHESNSDAAEAEEDPQADFPEVQDFCLAIGFITLGFVAMVAGLYSIFIPM